jgi:hypothetical protein
MRRWFPVSPGPTLYRLIKAKKLGSKLVAGRRLIELAALRELFAQF